YRREAEAPNAIWQADHTLLDILLTDEKGHAKKPWLTVILDDYSRGVAGYMVAFEAPRALHTALPLRQAIWRKPDPPWRRWGVRGVGTWSALRPRVPCTPRWPCGRPSGGNPSRPGRCAAFRASCIPITDPILRRSTSNKSVRT